MLTSTFPRWRGDSEPAFILELAQKLRDRGVEIFVLAPHAPRAKKNEKWGGIRIIRFSYFIPYRWEKLTYEGGIVANLKERMLARFELPLFLGSEFIKLWKVIRREKIDIVHSHWIFPQGLVAALAKKIIKFKLVVTAHAGMTVSTHRLIQGMIKFVYRQADVITANSQWNVEILSRILKTNGIVKIPMGVDMDEFSPRQRDENLRDKYLKRGLLLVSVGRFVEVKGYRFLIMAMREVVKRLSEAKLILIGFGPEEMKLKALAKNLGLAERIEFVGKVKREMISHYLASSDIFVLPSITCPDGSTEGFGLSLVEAMATGIPVIGSRVGGITDIIKDGQTGLLARERDPSSLAERILTLALDREFSHRLTRQGRDFVMDRYSWEKISSDFFSLYERLFI